MVQTRTRDYNVFEEVDIRGAEGEEEPDLPFVSVDPPKTWGISAFGIMEDHGGGSMVRDRYSGRAEGVAFNDWKTRFRSWQRTQRQRNALFNDWWAFEQLPNHLEFEALQAYDSWYENNQDDLNEVEDYWARRVELVTALKEGAAIPAATTSRTSDGADGQGEEVTSGPDAARAARLRPTAAASATDGTTTTFISRLSRASTEAIATIGQPPAFEPLALFFEHLEVEFGGIRRDRMRHIQDFKKEIGDTPRIMYARLSKFARESGDAFTERQLVELYMGKQDKKIRDMAHPHMLLLYGGRATLAQAFAIVEQLDRGLCVEEAGRLSSIMTSTTSQTKTIVGGPSKSQGTPKASKQIAMVAEAEETTNARMRCWNCGLLGHGKRDCPTATSIEGKSGKQATTHKGNAAMSNKGQQKKTQGEGTPPKCTYAPCSRIGHTEDKCWVKNPQLRPQSFTPQATQGGGSNSKDNNLEARMGELQNTLALLVAATAKITPTSSSSKPGLDRFEYGALGEVVAAVATRSQGSSLPVAPMVEENSATQGRPHVRHQGPSDSIGQSRLPLTFGLADVVTGPSLETISSERDSAKEGDMVKSLAFKLLEVPLFSGVQLQRENFDSAAVYHMAGKMMQGIVQMPANVAMKEMEESSLADGEEGTMKDAAEAAADALRCWKGWPKKSPSQAEFNSSLNSSGEAIENDVEVSTSYLATIPARATRERLQVKPGVVRLANSSHVFSVARGDTSQVFPQKVLLDTGAQPVMLGKLLAQSLGLLSSDLDPCPFTIATSLGGTEQPTGLTKEPLRLQFKVGTDAYTHISVRCVVTSATSYDILLGQQALYPIGFGHDSWTEEAWFRPGWSQGDGRKEVIPVIFGASAGVVEGVVAVYGCAAEWFAIGDMLLEGNMSATDSPPKLDLQTQGEFKPFERHPKDPIPPWISPKDLAEKCHELVNGVDHHLWQPQSTLLPLQQLVDLHDDPEGIVLVELFAGLGTGLAAVLEAGLSIRSYTYVDNNIMVNRAAKHHLQQLRMQYPKQLPASAIQGCMSRVPLDVTLIGEEDLLRLGKVDLVIAGWPCQGHSRAGYRQGLQDPRSNLFWELLRLLHWWQRNQITRVAYILENVPPLGDVGAQVHEDAKVVCQHLGQPIAIDAAALGSYAHRLRWKWTNLAHMGGISAALHRINRPKDRHLDDILEEGRFAQAVVQQDQPPLAIINHVGMPRFAFPTLMSYPRSFAFRNGGPGLVFDNTSMRLEEPCANERERAMGFPTGITCGPGLTESQRRHCLGQAMDLTSMVWFLGVCLAAQRHKKLGLEGSLGADASGQGAKSNVPLVEKITTSDANTWHDNQQARNQALEKRRTQNSMEWLVEDELRGQRVLGALAQNLGMEGATEKFKKVFLTKENPYLVTSPHSIDGTNVATNGGDSIGMAKGDDASIVWDKGNGISSSN